MFAVETKSTLFRTWLSAGAVIALGAATVADPETASAAETVEFTTVGASTWTVPENVSSLTVVARGGGGGGGTAPPSKGGDGALVTAEFPVSAGERLRFFVGGGGAVEGGGGGATSLFVTQSRFIVAGGGGGGGYGSIVEGIAATGGPAGFNADGSGLNGASIDFSEGGFGGRGGIGGPGGEKSGGDGKGGDGGNGGNGIAGPGGTGRNGAAGGAGDDLGGGGGDGFDGPTERDGSSSGGGGGGGYGGGGGAAAFFNGAGGGAGGSGQQGATDISYDRARNGGLGAPGGNGSITITYTAGPTPPQLLVQPNPVEFGSVAVGSSVTQDVQVTSTFSTPVGLKPVTEEGSRASFDWQVCEGSAANATVIQPGTSCVGRVVFAPEGPGSFGVSLLLEPYELDGNGQPTAKLPGSVEFDVSGNASCVKDCGPIVLGKPNPVDFSSVALGEIATDKVRVVNAGDETLRISKVKAADLDDEFSVVNPDECVNVALRPNESCSMQVRFAPGELGSRTGVLEVTSNSKAKTNAIGLTGVAKSAVIAKPGKVRKLQAPKKMITANKALVKWKKPKGKATITKYQTRIKKCQQKNDGQWNCKEPKWQKWRQKKPVANAKGWIKRDLTQLQPGTKYQVQVRAWSGDLKGPKSKIAFMTKRSDVPTKPGNG